MRSCVTPTEAPTPRWRFNLERHISPSDAFIVWLYFVGFSRILLYVLETRQDTKGTTIVALQSVTVGGSNIDPNQSFQLVA